MRSSTALPFLLSAPNVVCAAGLYARDAPNWPDPEPCSGNCSFIHDPSVLKTPNGTWWRLSTNGNIAVASAPNLTGPWTYHGAMLPGGSSVHVTDNQELWAPDVSLLNGTYYAYYAVSTIGNKNSDIGVATSQTLEPGSWEDQGSIGIPQSPDYNLIDPNFFREGPDAPIYFNYGSSWKGIFQTSLDDSFMKLESNTAEINEVSNSTGLVEGSFMFWWGVGGVKYYYMFFSSGQCCNNAGPEFPQKLAAPGDEYKIMACRSDHPTGPFVDQAGKNCLTDNGGTVVLASHGNNVYAPGGQGVLADPDLGGPALYYHYVNPNIGYKYEDFQFSFNYLDFSSGWPVVSANKANAGTSGPNGTSGTSGTNGTNDTNGTTGTHGSNATTSQQPPPSKPSQQPPPSKTSQHASGSSKLGAESVVTFYTCTCSFVVLFVYAYLW